MKLQNYLPSKAFQKKLLVVVVVIVSILVIVLSVKLIARAIDTYKLKKNIRQLPAELRSQVDILTVGELQTKDSNNNGFADWEERLYGLDPLADGTVNKKTVEEKRNALRANSGDFPSEGVSGETNDFTREFMTLITSLQVSGAINDETLANLAASIGAKIVPNSDKELHTQYDFKIVRDSKLADDTYTRTAGDALAKTSAIGMMGHEMEFLGESLNTSDPVLLAPLDDISKAYSEFAKALLATPVPARLLVDHKALVNSAEYIAQSLLMLQKIDTDPLVAIQGMAMYNSNFQIMNTSLDNLAASLNL